MMTGVQGNRDTVNSRHKAELIHSTFNFDDM